MSAIDLASARAHILAAIDRDATALRQLNADIHSHPETAYEEVYAHDALTAFLETRGFNVRRHTYGLDTSFEAELGGDTGPVVVICAEYDALPNIGHGCGHNLIATSSMAAFLGLAEAVKKTPGIAGRVRILGTPAEEGGGGKARLVEAGAFKDPDIVAAIMAHPMSLHGMKDGNHGIAGFKMVASHKTRVEFRGRGAHAGGDPWNGLNALDAAVAAYTSVSMLRQQIQTDERIHGVIEDGGTVPNVIPDYTRMNWYIRSPTAARADSLLARAKACFEAAALATGCSVKYIPTLPADCIRKRADLPRSPSEPHAVPSIHGGNEPTQSQGNVSHVVPSFHGVFGIPTAPNIPGHHPEFAKAAKTDEAHEEAIICARGLAMLGLRVLTESGISEGAKRDFHAS
ncbi:hypothetical protein UA08_00516 [Talaromyces atroroseus]|uniref:Peptidase M20 domain-containing protein 2 n=1 Tax=Talaromyces atroroseus TaxID=1441469 RepID=A0A225AQA2_TALAT|nr:hypothetical protein UA08_00516 [Talaromyces atroroseus]OKL63801.1 hypothetical protein UA08_00516 [Talaromyces atroroseus]